MDYGNTTGMIFMALGEIVEHRPGKNPLNFGQLFSLMRRGTTTNIILIVWDIYSDKL